MLQKNSQMIQKLISDEYSKLRVSAWKVRLRHMVVGDGGKHPRLVVAIVVAAAGFAGFVEVVKAAPVFAVPSEPPFHLPLVVSDFAAASIVPDVR